MKGIIAIHKAAIIDVKKWDARRATRRITLRTLNVPLLQSTKTDPIANSMMGKLILLDIMPARVL